MTEGPHITYDGGGHSISARVIRATHLNSEATSILIIPDTDTLVIGKNNGEVVFLPYNLVPSSCARIPELAENTQQEEVPITALCYGYTKRHNPANAPFEIISIACNGLLQVILPPPEVGYVVAPRIIFTQMMYSNICGAFLYDIDRDGQMELIVVMTDRVVRTYKFVEKYRRFLPLYKWDLPAQVSAFAVGESALRGPEAWVSQQNMGQYVCLKFIEKGTNSVKLVEALTKDVTKMLILPYRCYYVAQVACTIKDLIIFVNKKERRVHNPGSDIVAIASVRVPCFNMLISIDKLGMVFVYAYNAVYIKAKRIEPVLRFMSLPDVNKMTATYRFDSLVVCAVNSDKKVMVNTIPLNLVRTHFDQKLVNMEEQAPDPEPESETEYSESS